MRVAFLSCLLMTGSTLVAATATAGTPYEQEVICPVGGEKFKHTFTGSYSTFGSRPDGKPYGSWVFPMPIPVCPSNKLPLYAKFSKDQAARLEPLIASAEFKALAADMPYYRAAWLMERTGEDASDVAWMIVKASWEADVDQALKRKYQQDYVAKLLALPKGDDGPIDWLWMQARAANGMRELGRFPESLALIDALLPQAEAVLVQTNANSKAANQRDRIESAEYLTKYLKDLRAVSARGNASSEPVAMLPPMVARAFCKENRDKLNQFDTAACSKGF